MPEWQALIRARLAAAHLKPTVEMDVVEELAQHLDDLFAQLCAEGLPEAEARAKSLQELDGEEFLPALLDSLPRDS